ncbi:hypothetical protein [Endozoicomonas sp. 8E]|uniref:hypothetical protein n=1 Tax=Endozoicomonas sp. 8E TaxID=3035692 RepID=UPI0029394A1B|nr:hypothetical protein [Endozoicomonas sp. 8E]WOG30249.1 hypothetical protein P6910_11585 [Endozoicomonas sp. 8E]
MKKQKNARKRSPSAVLKLMQDPMFRQRREELKNRYNRKEKHRGRSDFRPHQKALNETVFSCAAC